MKKKVHALFAMLLVATLLTPLGATQAMAAGTQPGLSCSSNSPKVVSLHAPTFYEDLSVGFNAQWVGYRIDAVGVTNAVIASSLTASRLQTRTTNPYVNKVTDASGASYSTVYALMEDVGPKTGNLSHNLTFNIGANQYTCDFRFKSIVNASGTPGPTVYNISTANLSFATTAPILYSGSTGQRIALSVDGQAGVVEQNSLIALSPTPKVTWDPSINLQLISVRWVRGTESQMYRDQLWFPSGSMSSDNSYHVEYEFQVDVGAATTWQMSPAIYVQDSVSVEHSIQNGSAQFSVIDEPNTDFHTAVNHAFTGIMTVVGGSGSGYNWSLAPGQSLPKGLQLSSDGKITGTPTEIGGPTSVTFDVTSSSGGKTASKKVTVKFTIEEASITSNFPANGYLNALYGPIRISVAGMKSAGNIAISGNLPPGIKYANGSISGVPTALGTFSFSVAASGESDAPAAVDKNGKASPAKRVNAQRTYKITISERKPKTFQNYQAGFIDLSLGDGNGAGEPVVGTNGDTWGYAVAYRDLYECNLKSDPIYTNSTPPYGRQTGNFNGISTSKDPYRAKLHSGFCLQTDVLVDKKSGQPNLEVRNLKVNFTFYKLPNNSNLVDPIALVDLLPTNVEILSNNAPAIYKTANTHLYLKQISTNSNTCSDTASGNSVTFCLGTYTIPKTLPDKLMPLTLRFPLKISEENLNLVRVHVQVSSDNREYDNSNDYNGGSNDGLNNGCGNGDQASPGNSGNNNNAENSGGSNVVGGNCPTSSNNSNNNKKNPLPLSGTQTSSTASTSNKTTIGNNSSSSCLNNGFGNGDQASPGNSGGTNNAENAGGSTGDSNNCPSKHSGYCFNNDDESESSSSSLSSSSGNESGDGFEDGSDDENNSGKCSTVVEDYDNIADFWLGETILPTIQVDPKSQGPTGQPIPSNITTPPGFTTAQDRNYYAVTCYKIGTDFKVPDSSYLPSDQGIVCNYAKVRNSNPSDYELSDNLSELKNGTLSVEVPGFSREFCEAGKYYVATFLFEVPMTFVPDTSNPVNVSDFNSLANLISLATDPNIGLTAEEGEISAKTDKTGCVKIELNTPPNQGPSGNAPITAKVSTPNGFTPLNDKKYLAVICYRVKDPFDVTGGGDLPSDPNMECKYAKIEGSSTYDLTNALKNQGSSGYFVVEIPGFNRSFCNNEEYYVASFLFEVPKLESEWPTPSAPSLPSISNFNAKDFNTLSTSPQIGEQGTRGQIDADGGSANCITLTLPNPPTQGPTGGSGIPSKIETPNGFTPASGKKYYSITCYRIGTNFEVSVNGNLPVNTGVVCKYAKPVGESSYELRNRLENLGSVALNLSISGFSKNACVAPSYYVSSYLFEVPDDFNEPTNEIVDVTLFNSITSKALLVTDPSGISAIGKEGLTTVIPGGCNQGFSPPTTPTPPTPPTPTPPQPPLPAPTPNTPVPVLPAFTPIAQCSGGAFCAAVDVKKAETIFPAITGNQGRFVASAGLVMIPPGIPQNWTLAFPNSEIPTFKGKALFSLNSAGNGIIVTSDSGWTGFLHVNGIAVPPTGANLRAKLPGVNATTSNVAGIAFGLDIQIYPDPPTNGTYQNTADGKTIVNWSKSPTPTTVGYDVYVNGVKQCSSKTTTCTLNKLIGPRSTMTAVAIGLAKTRSIEMKPAYKSGKFALSLVIYYDTAKADLKPASKKALDILVAFVKREGYKNISVTGHTDVRLKVVNTTLSKARAQAVISYLAPRLKGVTFSGTGVADKVPYSSGKGKLSLALNRRAEVFVK